VRKFQPVRPQAEQLESRALLSGVHGLLSASEFIRADRDLLIAAKTSLMSKQKVMVKCVGGVFCVPEGPLTPPRTGGAAALVSPGVLLVVTNKPRITNTITIQDDGGGDVTVEWNGHTPPTFHGVSQIFVDARARANAVVFSLTDNAVVAQQVDVQLDGTESTFTENLGSFQTNGNLTFQFQTAPTPKNPAKGP
jgi:hypothetical protein